MSGGYESEETNITEQLQSLMDLGMSEKVARQILALMNDMCVKKFAKWKENYERSKNPSV